MRRAIVLLLLFVGVGAFVPAARSASGDAASARQTTGCPGDADCDGTPDSSDNCPTQPGGTQGCPAPADSDRDGTPDSSDACPTVVGPSSTQGCPPPPDGDADGVPDSSDACPAQYGPVNNQGCPFAQPAPTPSPTAPSGPAGPTADDDDADGVPDAGDKCANTYASEKVDADGCGPFRAEAFLQAAKTDDMANGPSFSGQCINPKGVRCTFHLTLTLSAGSARRLGLKRRIAEATFTAAKSYMSGKYLAGGKDDILSRAEERAFRRAFNRDVDVTMTFTGTYARGTGSPQSLPKSTFTMKRKEQGGAYHVVPMISNGPEGPKSGGLTRPHDPNDF